MVGRKSKIDKSDLFELLKTFKTDIVNALGKSTDPLWKLLCSRLDNKISPSGLYLIIQSNRYNCHGILDLIENKVLSECDDSENNEIASETAKLYLKKSIAGMDEMYISDDDNNDLILPQDIPNDENEDGCLKTWIDSLKKKSTVKYVVSSTDCIYEKDNFHYLPEFSNSFLKLLRTYPLWSAILIKHFNISELTASSSSVESYFNDLKNRSFNNDNILLRVDKFVCKHIKEIDRMLKITKHDEIFTKKLESPDELEIKTSEVNVDEDEILEKTVLLSEQFSEKNSDNVENIDLEYIAPSKVNENWKGLAEQKKKRTSYFAAPNPEVMHIEHKKKIEIALIKNGNIEN